MCNLWEVVRSMGGNRNIGNIFWSSYRGKKYWRTKF